jgi:hypothetical protein
VGIEITRQGSVIRITQEKYIESILHRERMEYANPIAMHMDPNQKLELNPDNNEPNCSNSYACLLGELQFLANTTRPDIAYAIIDLQHIPQIRACSIQVP